MLACLIAAALWAFSLAYFRDPIRQRGPVAVNFFKCTFACLCFWLWTIVLGTFPGRDAAGAFGLLALSGVIGMSIGDVLLFIAVREGGVQRALVLFNTSPLIALVLALPVYGTLPSPIQLVGMAAVLAGVLLVETDPVRRAGNERASNGGRPWLAFFAGLGGAAGQAIGIVLSHGPLQSVDIVPASAIRLTAASAGLLAYALFKPRIRSALRELTPRTWPRLALPSLFGSVIAIYFMMVGMRDVEPGISATLLATTPIFSLPVARFLLKEELGWRSALGTAAAVIGVVLIGG